MSAQETINITLEVWRQNGPQDRVGLKPLLSMMSKPTAPFWKCWIF